MEIELLNVNVFAKSIKCIKFIHFKFSGLFDTISHSFIFSYLFYSLHLFQKKITTFILELL